MGARLGMGAVVLGSGAGLGAGLTPVAPGSQMVAVPLSPHMGELILYGLALVFVLLLSDAARDEGKK